MLILKSTECVLPTGAAYRDTAEIESIGVIVCGLEVSDSDLREHLRITNISSGNSLLTFESRNPGDGFTLDEVNRHFRRRPVFVPPMYRLRVGVCLAKPRESEARFHLSATCRMRGEAGKPRLLREIADLREEMSKVLVEIAKRLEVVETVVEDIDDLRDQIAELRALSPDGESA